MKRGKLEIRDLYEKWKRVPKKEREPRTKIDFAKEHGVSIQTLMKWDKKPFHADLSKQIDDLSVEEQIKVFKSLMFKIVQNPNAPSMDRKLFAQMHGLITDKAEVKVEVGLTADEITRRNLEAERQLRAEGYRALPRPGMEKVPGISPLLHDEVCLDSESEHRTDS